MKDLKKARTSYLSRGEVSVDVRGLVLRSWQRCQEYGVHPEKLCRQSLDADRLAELRDRNRALLRCAEPVLRSVHETIGEEPHLIALADRDGNVLQLFTDPATAETDLEAANLFEGASWHERDIGSNGVGTALAEEKPVILVGPEHFQEAYINWTCIGIPIRNEQDEIIGVLDLSVPNATVRVHTWGWYLSAAQAIEHAFRQEDPDPDTVEEPELHHPENPMHAVRGVLEFVASQVNLPPTLQAFVDQARLEARAAEQHMLRNKAELERANRNKELFLATLAHEIAGPLAGLKMSLSLMAQKRDDSDTFDRVHERAERLANQLSRLLRDLRDVSSIQQGKIKLEKTTVDVAEIIDQTVATVQPKIKEREHRLHLDVQDEPLVVEADPNRLAQVFTNLLTNAAKYTRPGGDIWLNAGREGRFVTVRVRDTGIGISPDELPQLFDLFAQNEDGDQDGLGLGLHLVDRLVALHGGRVEAHSEGIDQGSEFIVRLPAAETGT